MAWEAETARKPFSEVSLDSVLETMPPKISHSPLTVPLSNGSVLTIPRRDLFDARFQLISQGTGDVEGPESAELMSALQFLDNPSDLVPLVYEGGLKTWECSVDLATYLSGIDYGARSTKTRILEIGCGTAIPTLYILHSIFSSPPSKEREIHVHLQDYNASVLQLITIPNIILTWYHSSAVRTFRSGGLEDHAESALNITPQLLDTFRKSLETYWVHIRLFSGSWESFDLGITGGRYDLVLTSETIYRLDSLPSLIHLMQRACHLDDDSGQYLCLVAAKAVYFGVGGGVAEFTQCVEATNQGARVETVLEKKSGVNRKVMSVQWL
ncbi:hypothetical protein BKA82DRAFT_996383 [Pisolithus tinctorius]|uniref:protein-histidine N-methyltransferase n=1 Tax=Pisolithus tinctorius Marx 270 TaxID=870435 RepID=A0A0C3PMH3_PISTI|nr:hypothetical protein BKA82DRAFT_996383 [Pisolithus tinctorius]KIO09554.1 hypothetical protein M404DRAFT_996383 [Pisolithus tinctorius Marx 270]